LAEIEITKLREECGVFGIYGNPEANRLTYLGLYALQHRGQESCGIVASDGSELRLERAMGHVSEAFNQSQLDRLRGSSAIGHVRYSTAGEVSILEAQPFLVNCQHGQIAVCHNGNLPFAREDRRRLEREGAIFSSTSDTEIVLHGVARSQLPIREAIPQVLRETEGAFSMLFLTPKELIAIRDSRGFRPLALGRLGDQRDRFRCTHRVRTTPARRVATHIRVAGSVRGRSRGLRSRSRGQRSRV